MNNTIVIKNNHVVDFDIDGVTVENQRLTFIKNGDYVIV